MDTVGVNNYVSWYRYSGHPETIHYQLSAFLEGWHRYLKKPIYMSEYGAGTIDGFHKVSCVYRSICYDSSTKHVHVQPHEYRIAGNFWGVKFS